MYKIPRGNDLDRRLFCAPTLGHKYTKHPLPKIVGEYLTGMVDRVVGLEIPATIVRLKASDIIESPPPKAR